MKNIPIEFIVADESKQIRIMVEVGMNLITKSLKLLFKPQTNKLIYMILLLIILIMILFIVPLGIIPQFLVK